MVFYDICGIKLHKCGVLLAINVFEKKAVFKQTRFRQNKCKKPFINLRTKKIKNNS